MPAECSGVNFVLRLRQEALEVRSRPFENRTMTIEIGKIKSIELLRKSVMPPAVLGGASLALGLILRLANDELTAIVPVAFRTPSQFLALGVAVVCLIVLVTRWLFANLILRPTGTPPIIVRMVPTHSARRFVMLVQKKAPNAPGV